MQNKIKNHLIILCLGLMAIFTSCKNEQEVKEVQRPNILFAISDDQSFPHAGAYGCTWVKTPAFDRVAKEGLLFNQAFTPNAKCSPSRAYILTGRNSWQLEEATNHVPFFPEKFKTFPEALAEQGYFVGRTGKGWAPGVAKKSELKALLVAELKKQGDPRILGQGDIFDNYQYAHPSSENFYERFTNGEGIKAGWVNPTDFEKEKTNE